MARSVARTLADAHQDIPRRLSKECFVDQHAWNDLHPDRPIPLWEGIKHDIVAHIPPDLRPRSVASWVITGAGVLVQSSGFHVTLIYRLAHALRSRLGPLGRALSGLAFWWGRHFYGCSIAPSARLFGGLILPHPQGLVIGADVVIGPRAWIFQNVTVGGAPGKTGMPKVGADARIYSGAVLTGPIAVGDNVMFGANVVVARDVPARTIVRPSIVEFSTLPSQYEADSS